MKNPFKYILNKKYRFRALRWLGLLKNVPDDVFLKLLYKNYLNKDLDLDNPITFNEKMQWLKLYNKREIYTIMADKYCVKKYISDKIGEKYVIPIVGGPWKKFDDIDLNKLPNQFVLKTNHDCGGVVVCKDKNNFDINKTKKIINKHLKVNYFIYGREWPYKNIQPLVFAEKYEKDNDFDYLPVYKFMCFNGEPKIIQTIKNDKQINETIDYFDINWNLLKLRQNYPNSDIPLSRPNKLEKMISIARKLAKGIPFVRVDLYSINDNIKFGEFTFFSDGGTAKFEPECWDKQLGDLINLNYE